MTLTIDPEFQQLMPPLSANEFAQLEANVLAEGCRDPLVVWDGIIIDGHNRYAICIKHGIPFQIEERQFASYDEAKIWIIENQVGRRNLSAYTRGVLALQLKEMLAAQARVRMLAGKALDPVQNSAQGKTRDQVAALANVSHDTISKIEFIETYADEALKAQLHAGDATIHDAYTGLKRAQIRQMHAHMAAPPLPAGKYACLVVDPPWPVGWIDREVRPNQVHLDYPVMTEEDLFAIDVPAVAADSCHLYLWTTHKFFPLAFKLVEHWGFNYQCLLTWIKNVGFTPYSWMYSTEHVLFCRRGNLDILKQGCRLDFHAPVREHSRKPDVFYDIVRTVSPGPRLDMFAREVHEGFELWGNEVSRFTSQDTRGVCSPSASR